MAIDTCIIYHRVVKSDTESALKSLAGQKTGLFYRGKSAIFTALLQLHYACGLHFTPYSFTVNTMPSIAGPWGGDAKDTKERQPFMTRPSIRAVLAALALLTICSTSALAAPSPSATASAQSPSPSAEATAGRDTDDMPDEAPSPIPAGNQNILIQIGDEGDNVILLQLRLQDLGYYNYKITGFFGDFTKDAVASFQSTNGIDSDGIAGAKTLEVLYSNSAKRKPVQPIVIKTNTTVKKSSVKKGSIMNWSVANQRWKIGTKLRVIDLDTGITYNMIRCNQSYSVGHADVAPATKADTANLKKTFDGNLSAYRRAVLVNMGGTWIAASIYAEPHGSTGVAGNGMNRSDGTLQQVCIHFRSSWTNGRGLVDSAHQYQIMRAAGQKPTIPRSGLVYPGD